ncbi:hypothetical protein [uncultured Croceitalea sp.]|uniref:hypothetical protein n=1 Tax=uncultured Croceitalea sp. TaxID=1798908 RepID=UPI00330678AE
MSNYLNAIRGYGTLIISLWFFAESCKNQNMSTNTLEKTRSEQWMEDIAFFESEFIEQAKTYTDSSRAATKKPLAGLKKAVDELSDLQIQLELSKAVVMADNGHTSLPLPLQERIPLRFYRFSDGIHVVKTDALATPYLGAKLLKVNAMDVDTVERALFPYVSGTESWKKFKTLGLITAPKILHALELGKKDSIALRLVKGKDTLDVTLAAQNVERDRSWFEAWADLYPIQDEESPWTFLKGKIETHPLYLKHAEEGVFHTFDEQEKIAYFQINSFWQKCPDIKVSIKVFHEILKTKRDYNVVFDLRFYTGGNYGVFTQLATKSPKIINDDQKIFLVLSDKTYSAGIVTAARIKHYAKDKLVIVGESVGDRLRFWAEGKAITLPHSKVKIYSAQKEHDWEHNKRSFFKTHRANYLYGVAAKNLDIDQEIKLGFHDYMENNDPVWEWIVSQSR